VEGNQEEYSNSFDAFPATATYRPPLATPRPHISGSQTALVVGKSGEEIWTDQYGRIKVKFSWDQSTPKDETSSCWVRVSTPWAGKQWGSIQIPRIGQEVVVSFLEGNPDRPLITGSVYNASETVPYTLPDNQTRSTFKSNSSKGGNGFNEICFEDKAGSEEIFIQAQKDMNVVVLNDSTATITKDETITVKGKRTMTVTGDEAHTNQANFSSTITKDETVTVKGKRTMTVTGNEAHTNQADFSSTVSGNFSLKVSGNLTIEASGSVSIKAGTTFTNKAGTDMTNDAGTTLTNKAAASQTVDGGGMLTVKGGMVKIN
jgi:type VI secretion system secreted protein VgrG